jgi:hypothetical protein
VLRKNPSRWCNGRGKPLLWDFDHDAGAWKAHFKLIQRIGHQSVSFPDGVFPFAETDEAASSKVKVNEVTGERAIAHAKAGSSPCPSSAIGDLGGERL